MRRLSGMSAPSVPDTARFEAAFETHHRRVLAYALRRCQTQADAEDVASETFMIAWRRIDQLPEADAALPWLLGVARRVAANRNRGSRRLAGLLQRLRLHASPPPVPAASPELDALACLRPDDQELLRLLAWEGLTQAEAGAVLGISANAVAIRLHRARRRFADELAKGSGDSRTTARVRGRPTRERST